MVDSCRRPLRESGEVDLPCPGRRRFPLIFSAIPTFVVLFLLFDLPSMPLAQPLVIATMVLLGFALFFAFCHLTALTTFFTIESWAVEYLRMIERVNPEKK